MTATPIVIVGAGGFGREVLDVLRAADPGEGIWKFAGFVADDEPDPRILQRIGAVWLGMVEAYLADPMAIDFVVGVGDPQTRRMLTQRLVAAGLHPATLIHPSATIGADVEIGEGSVICSHVSITTNVRLGAHVHLNLNSTVGHDTRIGDYVTINPLTAVSGDVTIEDEVMLGTNSAVLQGLTVEAGAIVGAGAVVVKRVAANTTVVGVPAMPFG